MKTLSPADKKKLDRYLDGIEHLPPTPTLLIRLIELFRQPDRDVDEIVALLRHDPSLTAEIMRCCNSSFFGNDSTAADVDEAVFRLGFYEIYRLAVTLFGLKSMTEAKVSRSVEVENIWRHCAITAVAGGAIAREIGESEGIAFTAGLLHDIGKIVLAVAEGPKYADVLERAGRAGRKLVESEKSEFGFHHGEVGAWMLGRWGVPDTIAVPVFQHHRTNWTGAFKRTAAIVNLADLVAYCIEGTAPDKPCEMPEAVHSMELLGLTHDDMMRLVVTARSDLKRSAALLIR